MIIRKMWSVIMTVLAVVVSYYLLFEVLEWLRVKAGVGSDTMSPIDFAAWQGCVFTAAVIAGSLSGRVLRSAGVIGVVVMLCILGICLAAQLDVCGIGSLILRVDGCIGSLMMDGCNGLFGVFAFPVLAWIIFAGLAVGWAMNVDQKGNRDVCIALAVLAGALVTLIIVFYPLDRYVVRLWGNG